MCLHQAEITVVQARGIWQLVKQFRPDHDRGPLAMANGP